MYILRFLLNLYPASLEFGENRSKSFAFQSNQVEKAGTGAMEYRRNISVAEEDHMIPVLKGLQVAIRGDRFSLWLLGDSASSFPNPRPRNRKIPVANHQPAKLPT